MTEIHSAPLRAIIVDDEPLALTLLRSQLEQVSRVEVIATCRTGKEAVEQIQALQPDVVFLDIQMPGLSGFDVISHIQADLLPMIVFVTAYDQYAVDAFDIHAVDYLLKPIDTQSLERAVSRCVQRKGTDDRQQTKQKVLNAMATVADTARTSASPRANVPATLVIKDRDSISFVPQESINWIDAAGDYMCVHTNEETHIVRSTLTQLIEQLNPTVFQRIHRSTVVNTQRVTKIKPLPKSEYLLILSGDERLKVSRNYRSVVLDLIKKHRLQTV